MDRGEAERRAPTIALVGGGTSVVALVEDLAATLPHDEVRLRLLARDHERLEAIAHHARHLVATRPGWRVDACRSLAEAAAGASAVVLMLRVGGLEARRADEELAWSFGIPGDEGLGPGGAANALRTLPVLDRLGRDLADLAPGAVVLNLVAPLGLTTRVLLDRGLDAVGVCELPGVTETELRTAVPSTTGLAYTGFNHLGWFWAVDDDDASRAGGAAALESAVAAGLVDRAVLDRFGAVPLKYFYWLHDTEAAARLGIGRDPRRADSLIELRDRARTEIAARPGEPSAAVHARPTPWFRDALLPMLGALLGGPGWCGYANVRNAGLVPALGAELVVEVPATVDAAGCRPHAVAAAMPEAALAFTRRVERSERLLHAAWRDDDLDALERSFVEGPHQVDPSVAASLADAVGAAAGVREPRVLARASGPRPDHATGRNLLRFEAAPVSATDYVVGRGAWHDSRVGAALDGRPVVVVVDREVARLHPDLVGTLVEGNRCIERIDLPGGERCKTQHQLDELLVAFEAAELPKHGAVVAIGGGAVCDVAGVASTLMRRSVPLVLLPTTLLAQVDAAIGGKNGINSPSTKNMIGHFHHPLAVACDPLLFTTLDDRQLVSGVAECIKVFAVADRDALDRHRTTFLERDGDEQAWVDLVTEAQQHKLQLLVDDPYERSSQRLLNYGHAFAHLLEERSGFQLQHGEAVLFGMLVENEVGCELGLADEPLDDLQATIAELVPPPALRHWLPFEDVAPDVDKVRQMRRSSMNLVCLRRPGAAVIVDDVDDAVLADAWARAEDRLRTAGTRHGIAS